MPYGDAQSPEIFDLDEAQAARVLSATGLPNEPGLSPEQSTLINSFIDAQLLQSDMYRAAEARRIVLDRQWWAGAQYTAIQEGKLVVAPAKLGYVPMIDDHQRTLVEMWKCIYAQTTPASWETVPLYDGFSDNLLKMCNALLRSMALASDLSHAVQTFGFHVPVDGYRFLYPRFVGAAGPVASSVSRTGQYEPEIDPRTGTYARTGKYVLTSLSATELLWELGARSLDESGYVIRLVRMTPSDATRLFGSWIAQRATRAINTRYWYRVRENISSNLFYGWADSQQAMNPDILLLDCWIRPERARQIAGNFPGIENGLRRVRLFNTGNGDWSRAIQFSDKGVMPLGKNSGTLYDEFWPRASVVTGKFPFFHTAFDPYFDRIGGFGIPALTRPDQTELNLLAFNRVNGTQRQNTVLIQFPKEEQANLKDLSMMRSNQPVFMDRKPEVIQFPGVDPNNMLMSDACRARMERKVQLFGTDLAQTPRDARAVNATVMSFQMETAEMTKRARLDAFRDAFQQAGQYILTDAAQSLPEDLLSQYAGDDPTVLAAFRQQASQGMVDVRVVMSEENTPLPRYQKEMVLRLGEMGFASQQEVRRAALGPGLNRLSPLHQMQETNARSLAQSLRNFDKMPVEEKIRWLPWQFVDDPARPKFGTDPTTGMETAIGYEQVAMCEVMGQVVQVPEGMTPAYTPELWVIMDPYIEASQSLICNPADLSPSVISQDAVKARHWYAFQAKNGAQTQQSDIQQQRMDLRKQGESDKPLVAELQSQGILD